MSSDLQFTTQSLWPGRYVIRATAPPGWHFAGATYQGRNVSDLAFDLNADLANVLLTFVNKSTTFSGTVQAESGVDVARAMVVVFPVESAEWVDYGRTSRRITGVPITAPGIFSIPTPPDGDYYIIAIHGDRTDDWQNPAILKTLATLATRLTISGEAPPSQTLRLRRIP